MKRKRQDHALGLEMGLQGLVLQAAGLAIGIVLSLIVLPFDILSQGMKKVVIPAHYT